MNPFLAFIVVWFVVVIALELDVIVILVGCLIFVAIRALIRWLVSLRGPKVEHHRWKRRRRKRRLSHTQRARG